MPLQRRSTMTLRPSGWVWRGSSPVGSGPAMTESGAVVNRTDGFRGALGGQSRAEAGQSSGQHERQYPRAARGTDKSRVALPVKRRPSLASAPERDRREYNRNQACSSRGIPKLLPRSCDQSTCTRQPGWGRNRSGTRAHAPLFPAAPQAPAVQSRSPPSLSFDFIHSLGSFETAQDPGR